MTSTERDSFFGRFVIPSASVFYRSPHSFAFVNLRPIVPGHVLVAPHRIVPLLQDLNEDEYQDLWATVRQVQALLREYYQCSAFNVSVQDGPEAGQSVPHVHVHLLPRKVKDFARNDDVYNALETWAPRDELQSNIQLEVAEDDQRRDRTTQEMSDEAAMYRSLLTQ